MNIKAVPIIIPMTWAWRSALLSSSGAVCDRDVSGRVEGSGRSLGAIIRP